MKQTVLFIIAAALLFFGVATSFLQLERTYQQRDQALAERSNEMFLFPNGSALQAMTFGYHNFVANILWFKTVSYFGKHYKGDQEYKWLEHMCRITIALDAQALHIPEFCTLMLAWESGNPDGAIKILDQAITANPFWRYYYLRGVSNIIFKKDTRAAKKDFLEGSKQEDAPEFLVRLATKTVANLESPSTAINFLKSMIARASDPNEKESLRKHLKRTQHEQKADQLRQLVEAYQTERGLKIEKLEEVITNKKLLEDLYGGTYFWNQKKQKVESSSGVPTGKIVSNTFEERVLKK